MAWGGHVSRQPLPPIAGVSVPDLAIAMPSVVPFPPIARPSVLDPIVVIRTAVEEEGMRCTVEKEEPRHAVVTPVLMPDLAVAIDSSHCEPVDAGSNHHEDANRGGGGDEAHVMEEPRHVVPDLITGSSRLLPAPPWATSGGFK
uniref:Uncharacterized protein n=1 Tax=Oryza barthii TaxID=65489 RepID=A0A0D3GQD6_9ORYZ